MSTPEKDQSKESNFKKGFLKALGFIALLALGSDLLLSHHKPPQPK